MDLMMVPSTECLPLDERTLRSTEEITWHAGDKVLFGSKKHPIQGVFQRRNRVKCVLTALETYGAIQAGSRVYASPDTIRPVPNSKAARKPVRRSRPVTQEATTQAA